MKKVTLIGLFMLMVLFINAQSLLRGPQKVVIDTERNRYLISNYNTGDIVEVDSEGNQAYFIQDADFIDGLEIVGDTVYGIASNGSMKAYDLITKQLVMNVTITASNTNYLSSITSDSAGHLFISCPALHTIYKFRISDESYWVFAKNNGLIRPNGILLERDNNRIVVINDSPNTSNINAISLSDSTVTLLASTNFNNPDGITRDKNGFYYVGGYYLPAIYRFHPNFSSEPEIIFEGSHMIYPTYNAEHHSLLVTYYGGNDWGEIMLESNLLNNPESVVYDSIFDRYLVSSCGDGHITQIDREGNQTFFSTELTYTLGLHIVGDTLFVSSNGDEYPGVVGFLLSSGEIVFYCNIPEKELLNDITADLDGNLYVTDCDANKVFKISISDATYTTFVDSGVGYPNGILYDVPNDRLLVLNCLLPNRPLISISMDGLTITTLVETNINSIDGLTSDDHGNFYFSSWTTDNIYRYDPSFTNPPEIISSGHTDPADIFFNRIDGELAIPNYTANIVEYLQIYYTGNEEIIKKKMNDNNPYPNPVTDQLNFDFNIAEKTQIQIFIYDILGNKISEVLNKEMNSGEYSVIWDGTNLEGIKVNSGIYFLRYYCNKEYHSYKFIKQ